MTSQSALSQYLISEQFVFVVCLAGSLTKIEYTNKDHLLAKSVRKIRLFCLKKDGSVSSTNINEVVNFPDVKANLFFLGQLGEQGVDMKTTTVKIYLHQREKTVITISRIGYVWLMIGVN